MENRRFFQEKQWREKKWEAEGVGMGTPVGLSLELRGVTLIPLLKRAGHQREPVPSSAGDSERLSPQAFCALCLYTRLLPVLGACSSHQLSLL